MSTFDELFREWRKEEVAKTTNTAIQSLKDILEEDKNDIFNRRGEVLNNAEGWITQLSEAINDAQSQADYDVIANGISLIRDYLGVEHE